MPPPLRSGLLWHREDAEDGDNTRIRGGALTYFMAEGFRDTLWDGGDWWHLDQAVRRTS